MIRMCHPAAMEKDEIDRQENEIESGGEDSRFPNDRVAEQMDLRMRLAGNPVTNRRVEKRPLVRRGTVTMLWREGARARGLQFRRDIFSGL